MIDTLRKMANKKKLQSGIQANKLIAELPEKRKNKSTGAVQTSPFRITEKG